ncbi:hypothetical protein ACFPYJ_32440 [Paenibacillus solisilvae]|uniref:Uncharacterized protein n=1 Tax=Paenibacillus solisilvae TaxID=2486751 RepID=A0ABW0W6F3_9BACL
MLNVNDRVFVCFICNQVLDNDQAKFLYKTAFKSTDRGLLNVGVCLKEKNVGSDEHIVEIDLHPFCQDCPPSIVEKNEAL